MTSLAEYLALGDPEARSPLDQGLNPDIANVPTAAENFEQKKNEGTIIGLGPNFPGLNGGGAGTAAAQRAIAMKRLDIERKKLEFQKATGLRDIGQAREKGLKGAINNALQRGLFRSGITIENKAEVNRESDEAASDLTTNIQFALDDLKLRRESAGIAGKGAGGGDTGSLTEGEAKFLANEENIFARDEAQRNQSLLSNVQIREQNAGTGGGVVPIQPVTRPGSPS